MNKITYEENTMLYETVERVIPGLGFFDPKE